MNDNDRKLNIQKLLDKATSDSVDNDQGITINNYNININSKDELLSSDISSTPEVAEIISDGEAKHIYSLYQQIVNTENIHPAGFWSRFNAYFHIPTYKMLQKQQYIEAIAYFENKLYKK